MEKISSLIGPTIGVAYSDDAQVNEEDVVEKASHDDAASRMATALIDFIISLLQLNTENSLSFR